MARLTANEMTRVERQPALSSTSDGRFRTNGKSRAASINPAATVVPAATPIAVNPANAASEGHTNGGLEPSRIAGAWKNTSSTTAYAAHVNAPYSAPSRTVRVQSRDGSGDAPRTSEAFYLDCTPPLAAEA